MWFRNCTFSMTLFFFQIHSIGCVLCISLSVNPELAMQFGCHAKWSTTTDGQKEKQQQQKRCRTSSNSQAMSANTHTKKMRSRYSSINWIQFVARHAIAHWRSHRAKWFRWMKLNYCCCLLMLLLLCLWSTNQIIFAMNFDETNWSYAAHGIITDFLCIGVAGLGEYSKWKYMIEARYWARWYGALHETRDGDQQTRW